MSCSSSTSPVCLFGWDFCRCNKKQNVQLVFTVTDAELPSIARADVNWILADVESCQAIALHITWGQQSSSSVIKCRNVFLEPSVNENPSQLIYANPLYSRWSLFHQLTWPFWLRTMELITMTMRGMMGEEKRRMAGGGVRRCKIFVGQHRHNFLMKT